MKKRNIDQLYAHLLQSDKVGEPDKAIEDRLTYSFLLKNSSLKLKQNSFGNFFTWIFSVQSLGMKTALISMVLFLSVINNHLSFEPGKITSSDSIFSRNVIAADSVHLILPIDSIRTDSLN